MQEHPFFASLSQDTIALVTTCNIEPAGDMEQSLKLLWRSMVSERGRRTDK